MTRSLLLACLATALVAEALPQPAALPDAQAFAVVVVPSLKNTLTRCEQIADLFAPGMVKAGVLADVVGRRIDDPGLGRLADGPVVIVLGPGGMAPAVACLIPSSEPALHAAALRQAPLLAEVVGDLVVVGRQAGDLALGKRLAATYPALADQPVNGDLRLLVAPSRIVAAYRPVLGGLLQVMAGQMNKQPNGAEIAAILTLEAQALLMISDQVDAMQIDVDLADQTITSHTLITAVPGSKLAAAMVAPLPAQTPAPALRMGGEPGYMACTARFNSQALSGWAADLLVDLQQQPEGANLIPTELITMTRDMGSMMNGGFAMRMRAVEASPMVMDAAFDCRDGAALDRLYEGMLAAMFGDTTIGRMYAAMGMDATLERDVRRSGGFAVQRIHYSLDAAKLPAGQAEQMRSMMQDVEYAVIPGVALLAQQPADLDRLIQGGAGELTTTAARTFGPGRDGYVDVDYLGMMKAFIASPAMQAIQGMPFGAALAATPAGEPTGMTWSAADGRVAIDARIPLKPFADLAAAFRQAGGQAEPAEQPVF